MEIEYISLTKNQLKRPFDKIRKYRNKAETDKKVFFYINYYADGTCIYQYDDNYNIPVKTYARTGLPPLTTKLQYVINEPNNKIVIKGFHVYNEPVSLPMYTGYTLMEGYIPKDSYYYENDENEIVTNTLVCNKFVLNKHEINTEFKQPIPYLNFKRLIYNMRIFKHNHNSLEQKTFLVEMKNNLNIDIVDEIVKVLQEELKPYEFEKDESIIASDFNSKNENYQKKPLDYSNFEKISISKDSVTVSPLNNSTEEIYYVPIEKISFIQKLKNFFKI